MSIPGIETEIGEITREWVYKPTEIIVKHMDQNTTCHEAINPLV